MVFHSNAVAMIELYYAIPKAQLPWTLPKWSENTGLQGLFGAGPCESPSEWSPDDRAAVKNFFEAYNSKPTVDAKLTFASARSSDDYKGRGLWRNFIALHWKKWKVQSVILAAFEAKSVLYTQVMVANELDEVPENIPFAEALDQIAFFLFGPEALDATDKVKHALRKPILTLARNVSQNLRKATRSLVKRLDDRKEEIESLLEGEWSAPCSPSIPTHHLAVLGSSGAAIDGVKEVTRLVAGFKKDTKLFPSEKNLEALENFEGELAGIMVSLGGIIEKAIPGPKKQGE
jgi:hypothetical protein